ncbi:MAG TPA: lytic transglycosylase domain-containing protein [Mycobacteriales bacterium]|nr:lytic transglycosylase domain-containing protein [Mycobacteriales bacterium]
MPRQPAPPRAVVALGLVGLVGLLVGCSADVVPLAQPPVATSAPAPSASALPAADPTSPAPITTAPSPPPAPVMDLRSRSIPPIPRPGEPVAAADNPGLAAQLVESARVIRDESAPPAALRAAAFRYQVAVRALVDAPARREPTYAALPTDLRATVRSEVVAGAALRAMVRRPKAELPAWRIVAPAPAAELLSHYRAAAAEFGVPWQHLAAINLVETRMGRIRGTSSAGAQGPMQFMPATWRSYGEGDIHSNRDAIRAAARYLRASGAPRNLRRAVYAYNHDDRYVDAVLRYAERMQRDPRAYHGYHAWQVYYVTVKGDVWLPEGFHGS